MKKLEFYTTSKQEIPLKTWLSSLDRKLMERIIDRFTRVQNGNYGDFKQIADEIFELRFCFGPGYRIYFSEVEKKTLLLLNGGTKSSQSKDIKQSKEYLKIWKGLKNE